MSTNASNITQDQVSDATFVGKTQMSHASGTRVNVVVFVPKIGNIDKQQKTALFIALSAAYKLGFVIKDQTKIDELGNGFQVWFQLDCKKNMRVKKDFLEAPYLEVSSSEDGTKNLSFYHESKYENFLADHPMTKQPAYRRGDTQHTPSEHTEGDTDIYMPWCPFGLKCKDFLCEGNHQGRKSCRNQFDEDGKPTKMCTFSGSLFDGQKSSCMHNHRKDNRQMTPGGHLPKARNIPTQSKRSAPPAYNAPSLPDVSVSETAGKLGYYSPLVESTDDISSSQENQDAMCDPISTESIASMDKSSRRWSNRNSPTEDFPPIFGDGFDPHLLVRKIMSSPQEMTREMIQEYISQERGYDKPYDVKDFPSLTGM
jgi:hypothetical protein